MKAANFNPEAPVLHAGGDHRIGNESRILQVMAERCLRNFRCRDAVRKRHRAQSGVADGCETETQDCFFADRMRVLESKPHEATVRMLASHEGLAKGGFA